MQPLKKMDAWLSAHTDKTRYLFTPPSLYTIVPELSKEAFKSLLFRATQSGVLTRMCRGVYAYTRAIPANGLVLFHVAAVARRNYFNYISLETALSDAGVISQVPLSYISVMSTGRSRTIHCKKYGTIDFIHTERHPNSLMDHLVFDEQCGLWRADTALALKDMRATKRSLDLIDWSEIDDEATKKKYYKES